jgi:hypothetical protein
MMTSTKPISFDRVRRLHQALGLALVQSGIPADRAWELIEGAVSARCSQCGQTITGNELVQAELSCSTAHANLHPRVTRLAQGYCAAKGCDSHYCELLMEEASGIDWSSICAAAERLCVNPAEHPVQIRSRVLVWRLLEAGYGRGRIVGCAVLCAVLALGTFWWFRAPAYSRETSGYHANPISSYQMLPNQVP